MPASSPTIVNIVPSSPDPAALVSGQIDGYCGYVTNQGVMLKTRGVDIYALNAQELGLPETTGTIYGREDFLAANSDLVVAFLKGAVEALAVGARQSGAHGQADGRKVRRAGPQLSGAVDRDQREQALHRISDPASAKGLLALDLPLYQKIIEIYRKVGMVKTTMTAQDLCDPSYIDAALAGLKA